MDLRSGYERMSGMRDPRQAIGIAAIALALAGCGGQASGTDAGAAPSPKLFLAGDGELWVVDVNTEQVKHLPMPALGAGDPPHRIAAIGDLLALWGDDVATVPMADPSAAPKTIAKDDWIFVPALEDDRIWVGFLDPKSSAAERRLSELREIDADGNVLRRDIEPPGGAWPYAEMTSGLLFPGGKQDGVSLWDPEKRRFVRSIRWETIGDIGPVSGDLLASGSNEGNLTLTDFASGEQRRIRAPAGFDFVAYEATFSPDGRTLAVPVKAVGAGGRSDPRSGRKLGLLDLDSGETAIVAGSAVPAGYVFSAWAAEGNQVFLTGGERFKGRTIVSYRLGEPRARTLDVEVGDFYDLAAG